MWPTRKDIAENQVNREHVSKSGSLFSIKLMVFQRLFSFPVTFHTLAHCVLIIFIFLYQN